MGKGGGQGPHPFEYRLTASPVYLSHVRSKQNAESRAPGPRDLNQQIYTKAQESRLHLARRFSCGWMVDCTFRNPDP